jgi:hypothetical protein
MKVRIKTNHWLPKMLGVAGITLYPFVFLDRSIEDARKCNLVQHEWIHVRQVRKIGWLNFYSMYLYTWLCGVMYADIFFEKEAYEQEDEVRLPDIKQIRKNSFKES